MRFASDHAVPVYLPGFLPVAAGNVDALAFEFMVLTAARGVEVRGAVWADIDRAERIWTVPAEPHEERPPAPGAVVRPGAGDS